MGRNIVGQLRDQGIAPGAPTQQAQTQVFPNQNIMKTHLNNLSGAGGVIVPQGPSMYDINGYNTNQQMY